MIRSSMTALLKAACSFLICTAVWAQAPAVRLEGIIQNASDNAIPGAVVTAQEEKNAWRVQVTSDDDGRFVFPALPLGAYTVSVKADGYRTLEHTNVLLTLPGCVVENFTLEPGTSKEVVKEEAIREKLRSTDSSVSGAFIRRDIDALPQLHRSPLALPAFQPGIQMQGGNLGSSSVNGTRLESNNILLDGMDVNDPVSPSLGLSMTPVSADSIEQIAVITNGASAEYGRNAGAQVLLTTRSGGDRWFGSVSDYFRHKALNANDFFNNSSNVKRPRFSQNIYGASIGGPAVKGRTYLFGDYQGRRTARETVQNRTVLTPEAKAGVFRWVPPGVSTQNSYNIIANDPRKLGIDRQVVSVLGMLPDPNNTDIGDGLNTGGYRFNNPYTDKADQATLRMDHTLNNNHRLFVRFSWGRGDSVDAANGADARFPGQPQGMQEERYTGFSAGSDWNLNPRMTNQVRGGYQQGKINLDRPARKAGPMALSNTWTDPLDSSFSRWRNSPVIKIDDNLTWIRGNHALKAGATFRSTSQQSRSESGIYPDVTFGRGNGNTPPTSIGPSANTISQADRQKFENLYNDLLGRMQQVTQVFYGDLQAFLPAGTARSRTLTFREYGAFLQDDWKFRPNLTLNAGVRYEFGSVPTEKDGIQGSLNPADAISITAKIANFTLQRGAWYKNKGTNFAPRAGFAWAPLNSTKMILRGGYGIFFDRLPGLAANFVDNNTPASSRAVSVFPNLGGKDVRLSDGIPLPAQPGAPVLTNNRSTTAAIFLPDLRTPYVHQFHLTLQRRLLPNTIVEAAYVGERGSKLLMNLNLNQLKVAGDFLQSFKEIQTFRSTGTPVSSANTLVRIFGSVNGAVSAIGGSVLDQGSVGIAANTVDRNYFGNYAGAGVSDFYLRNYPQFDRFIVGTNEGSSSYDSLQISARSSLGPLKVSLNYTWSKAFDNISSNCGDCALPMDSFNPQLNRALSDMYRPRVLNAWLRYDVPYGKDKALGSDSSGFRAFLFSNWTIGALVVRESGSPFSVSSGLKTARESMDSWANYTGSRQIGSINRQSDGVYWFTADQIKTFSFPGVGEIGSSGRNIFLGPDYYAIDMSLARRFQVPGENGWISFRAEIYNAFNHTNFGRLNTNLSDTTSFGKFSSTQGNPRLIQVALRYEF